MATLASVIVATYRREHSLREALFSLLGQDYRPLEIVVVDDNADPAWNATVCKIVKEAQYQLHAEQQLSLVVNSSNRGAATSRNAGIQASHGEYITFLDDDDVYLPSKVGVQIADMQTAQADYSLMDLTLVTEQGRLVEIKTHPYLKEHLPKNELIRLHLMHHLTGTDAMMFRRDYLLKIGCFGDIDIGDEFYLMMKAIENGGQLAYLQKSLVRACVHYDGSGLSGGPRKVEGEHQLYAFKRKYFPLLGGKDIRSIRMRHHAVLAFAHLKAKHTGRFGMEALLSLISSPCACFRMLYQRWQKT